MLLLSKKSALQTDANFILKGSDAKFVCILKQQLMNIVCRCSSLPEKRSHRCIPIQLRPRRSDVERTPSNDSRVSRKSFQNDVPKWTSGYSVVLQLCTRWRHAKTKKQLALTVAWRVMIQYWLDPQRNCIWITEFRKILKETDKIAWLTMPPIEIRSRYGSFQPYSTLTAFFTGLQILFGYLKISVIDLLTEFHCYCQASSTGQQTLQLRKTTLWHAAPRFILRLITFYCIDCFKG